MRTTNPAKAKSIEVTDKIIFPDATEQATKARTFATNGWTANKLLKGAGAGADPTEIDVSASLVLEANLGTDHTYSGMTMTGIAGENLVFGDCVYRKTPVWWKVDADFEASTKPMIAMVCATINTGSSGILLLTGFVRDDSAFAFTDGDPVFISTTPGALTSIQPAASGNFIRKVGFGCGATGDILWFCPDHTVIEVA